MASPALLLPVINLRMGMHTHTCTLSACKTKYDCATFNRLVKDLHSPKLVARTTATKTSNSRTIRNSKMRVWKRAKSMLLLTPPQSFTVVKVKAMDRPTSPDLLTEDMAASSQMVKAVRSNDVLANIVVESADVVPGYVCVMEKCVSDAWTSDKICGEFSLLQYLRFGIVACGTLARQGTEARDYKAANVGIRRRGSPKSKFCIIDVAQLIDIDNPDLAVCTYPACGAYTYGTPGSYVGLAATAWSIIADMFAMCGHDCRRLCHETILALPPSTPAKSSSNYEYGSPVLAQEMLLWLESDLHADCPVLASVLTKLIETYTAVFKHGISPKNKLEAQADADVWYTRALDIVDTTIRHQHAAIM